MKSIRFIAAIMFFAAAFAIPAFAQATTASGATVVYINSAAFGDEKTGITRYVTAAKSLETEFAPRLKELETMTNQYNALVKELQTLQQQAQNGTPVKQDTIGAKADQAEKLKRELAFKQQEAQAAYQKRQEQILGPIIVDIMDKALQDYATSKGYAMVFDVAKDQNGMLVWADFKKADVTADFIKFCNARPASATTTAPK
jgi:Skp family chaperone for outer membrane proteins